MTVSELIKFFQKQDQNAMVLLSSDSEGNSYSPLDIENCGYATGDFKEIKDYMSLSIYSMDELEMQGNYIILYPR